MSSPFSAGPQLAVDPKGQSFRNLLGVVGLGWRWVNWSHLELAPLRSCPEKTYFDLSFDPSLRGSPPRLLPVATETRGAMGLPPELAELDFFWT